MVGNPEFPPVGSFRWRKIKSTEVERLGVGNDDEEEKTRVRMLKKKKDADEGKKSPPAFPMYASRVHSVAKCISNIQVDVTRLQ